MTIGAICGPIGADAIASLEQYVRALPQAELPTRHFWSNDDRMYCRAVFRKAGVVIIGKVHKKEHLYLVMHGRVQIGKTEYPAGSIVVSTPGTQRAVFALEDSECATVHLLDTPTRDLNLIEQELLEPCPDALFDSSNKLKALTMQDGKVG